VPAGSHLGLRPERHLGDARLRRRIRIRVAALPRRRRIMLPPRGASARRPAPG
jgi:hypothetical protein